MRKLNISQIVASVEAEASGPSYTVPRLSSELAELGHDVTLHSIGPASIMQIGCLSHKRHQQDFSNFPNLSKLRLSHELHHSLRQSSSDIFHAHGLWLMPNVYPAWVARSQRRHFVLSPRGMLGKDALKFSRLIKNAFWYCAQKHAVNCASCLHATSDQEYDDIRAFGLRQPVAVVPNGVDVQELEGSRGTLRKPTVLSLGRIHPKKGLRRLVKAWKIIEDEFPSWCLEIVGPSELNHANELMDLVRQLKLKRVSISGPVFGKEKMRRLEEAEIFVLSTLNENFGMTVAESLAAETPVISTKGAPWSGLVANNCGWWIDHGVAPLSAALRDAMTLNPKVRRAMGARGKAWMKADFGWSNIALEMTQVYEWLYGGGSPPPCVRM